MRRIVLDRFLVLVPLSPARPLRKTLFMISAAAFFLLALATSPAEPCNQNAQGQLWPAEASLSQAAMRQSVLCGQLYICERGNWRHQWRQVAVPYWQLAGKPRPLQCALPVTR